MDSLKIWQPQKTQLLVIVIPMRMEIVCWIYYIIINIYLYTQWSSISIQLWVCKSMCIQLLSFYISICLYGEILTDMFLFEPSMHV